MKIDVITLFPEMIDRWAEVGVVGRAVSRGIITIKTWNPREFTENRYKNVDDRPYGGGPGMVMQVQPLRDTVFAAKRADESKRKVIYCSPQGRLLDQQAVSELATEPGLILVAGRYEGVDERFIETFVDEEWSIGDYVLSGGELAAMVMVDSVSRLIPGVLGHEDSAVQDSFVNGLLDTPHYTRPEEIDGRKVPDVLLGGNHASISRWRQKQSLGRTFERRPDLFARLTLSVNEQRLLDEYLAERRCKD